MAQYIDGNGDGVSDDDREFAVQADVITVNGSLGKRAVAVKFDDWLANITLAADADAATVRTALRDLIQNMKDEGLMEAD